MAQLLVVALLVSPAGVFFDVAHGSVLPYVLPRRRGSPLCRYRTLPAEWEV
ncbi:hypothetical protein [Streptomyces lydicus]|uniref:hypothetical protein n=1 Tax=Streptomyces lydicus TaxID=47763 RepID=UPI0013E90559|nr:hypothetical protein [Streptomyces lydicus]MCZ1008093.1 hypothetical protein [Streptomyces lydicus]